MAASASPSGLARHLPRNDRRLRLAPGTVAGVVVRNIVVGHRPLYALAEWAGVYAPGLAGLGPGDAAALNDDRVGRALDRLFDADRATLLTETVLGAVSAFGIDCSELHNDSTSVTFSGDGYERAAPPTRGGKQVPVVTHGHNKDFRPDLRQLVYVLTIASDGAVPVALRIADGNTNDDVTHVPTWDELAKMLGRRDFLYVADAKLCSAEALGHIASGGGRFVTVVPRGRREDKWFKDWIQTHAPTWQEAVRVPGARHGDDDRVWRTFVAPAPSTDGYRVVWIHSSAKAAREAAGRAARIEAGLAAIDALEVRLSTPRSRLRTRVAAESAAAAALVEVGAARWVAATLSEDTEVSYSQERRGRPGASTRYRRSDNTVLHVSAAVDTTRVAYDARADGCFPLITNDETMTPAEVLAAYRYQPNLERRHHVLKGPQQVAPVHLNGPHRIEALLTCHFFAQLTEALIERQIRTAMRQRGLEGIPLYPRAAQLPRAVRHTRARHLRPRLPPPSPKRRQHRAGLRPDPHRPATPSARAPRCPSPPLHVKPTLMTATISPSLPPAWAPLRSAIHTRQAVGVSYHGRWRLICPHALGWKHNRAMVLGYQIGGQTTSGALDADPNKRWRCLYLDEIDPVTTDHDAPWQTPANYNPQRPFNTIDQLTTAI